MTSYEMLSIFGQYVGLALIFYGIHSMRKGTERREQENIRHHEENMEEIRNSRVALDVLIEGHKESTSALRALIEEQREGTSALKESTSALGILIEGQKTLIERTSG